MAARAYKNVLCYFTEIDVLCDSFHRAAPFVEHLQKLKIYIIKIQKKKIQRLFHIWLVFVTRGLRLNSIKIFCLTNRITTKTYDIIGAWITQVHKVIAQKCNYSAKLQRSNLVWAMFENVALRNNRLNNYFEKSLLINLSHSLDNLHTLNKFSFTFRSRCSQIIFKMNRCLKKFAIFKGKHLCRSLFLIMLHAFSHATVF